MKKCSESHNLHLCNPGVTPVDGSPGQAFSDCYPVVLDGTMVGWVESELAPILADSLRRFKVRPRASQAHYLQYMFKMGIQV